MEETPYLLSLLVLLNLSLLVKPIDQNDFPDRFLFGVSSSAYQIEGAWHEGGKGENIWDHMVHTHPEKIKDNTTGDIACDSYHKYKQDVALIKELGLDVYRFSISWSRIFPTGRSNQISADGVQYYNNLIDELLYNNIQPIVTLFHADLPQPLQDLGGLINPLIIEYFIDYSQFAFETFGKKVKFWITFNAPASVCELGYGLGLQAPLIHSPGVGNYMCSHNILKAHARAYHLYHDKYKPSQNGRVGITFSTVWFEHGTNQTQDIEAANRALEFEIGRWANPICGKDGDYPLVVKEFVANRSKEEGYAKSRLPEFTKVEIYYIKGTLDFFGSNYYTSKMVSDRQPDPIGEPEFGKDMRIDTWHDPTWEGSEDAWLKVTPWGLRKMLKWIKDKYGNPDILITENGFPGTEELNDQRRIRYYEGHFKSLLESIYEDDVNVMGYLTWTLMDNFEWISGYTIKFGLYHVNFSDPDLPRTARASADYYKEVVAQRKLIPSNSTIPTTVK